MLGRLLERRVEDRLLDLEGAHSASSSDLTTSSSLPRSSITLTAISRVSPAVNGALTVPARWSQTDSSNSPLSAFCRLSHALVRGKNACETWNESPFQAVSRNHAGTSSPPRCVRLERRRVERVEAAQLDLVALRAARLLRLDLADRDVGQARDREELARPHRLQQVAHHEVGRRLDVGGRDADLLSILSTSVARVRLDREADHEQLVVALHVRLARRLVDELLADGAVLRAEDDRHRRAVRLERRLGRECERLRRRPDVLERDRLVAGELQRRVAAQRLEHPVDVARVVRDAGVLDAVAVDSRPASGSSPRRRTGR